MLFLISPENFYPCWWWAVDKTKSIANSYLLEGLGYISHREVSRKPCVSARSCKGIEIFLSLLCGPRALWVAEAWRVGSRGCCCLWKGTESEKGWSQPCFTLTAAWVKDRLRPGTGQRVSSQTTEENLCKDFHINILFQKSPPMTSSLTQW